MHSIYAIRFYFRSKFSRSREIPQIKTNHSQSFQSVIYLFLLSIKAQRDCNPNGLLRALYYINLTIFYDFEHASFI